MKIQLSPSLSLTTDHPASSYGMPVLVNSADSRQAYGPADIVAFYNKPPQPAAMWVRRLAKTLANKDDIQACASFLKQWPEGPQIP